MKIQNYALINILNVLGYFASYKLPQKISYAITRNTMILSKEYAVYDAELRKIFKQYDEYIIKDDEGNARLNQSGIPLVEPSVMEEFNNAIAELLNIEIEVELYPVDESVFEYDDDERYSALSANEIMELQSILCK